MMSRNCVFWVFLFTLFTLHSSLFTTRAAHVEFQEGLTVVHLDGSPYELGYQHGQLLKDSVRQAVQQIVGYFRGYTKIPWLGSLLANWWLDRPWAHALPFLPPEYLEELRGLAAGSGVALKDLWRLHAVPDRTYACSSFAAWGQATADGRLLHMRNLDWNAEVGIQQYATVFVVHPRGRRAFVSLGWAGFIGVLTGINDQQISIGQVGAETLDVSPRGLPMTFLMRRVLEEAEWLQEGITMIRGAPRTVGVNYVLADAKIPTSLVVETTRSQAVVFEADDEKEHAVLYARPMDDCVFRADTAMDPQIRARQLASKGNPRRRGLEPPGGSAYETRYLGQATGLATRYGQLDVEGAKAIAKAVAPDSNIQSVIFAWPEAWIANAAGKTPAAKTTYHRLDLEELFIQAAGSQRQKGEGKR